MDSPKFWLTSAIRANKDSTIDHFKDLHPIDCSTLDANITVRDFVSGSLGHYQPDILCRVNAQRSALQRRVAFLLCTVFEIPTQPPPVDSPHHHAALAIFHLFRRSLCRVCAWTRGSSRQSQYCRDMEFRLPSCHYWSGKSHLPFSSTHTDTQLPIVLYFQGFANPANMSFIYPKNSGVSYAL